MFDPPSTEKDMLQPDLIVDSSADAKTIFPFPLAETEKSLIPHKELPPTPRKLQFIFLLNPDEDRISRLPIGSTLQLWLHELIGWGVFLIILGAFLGIQIYLNQFLSGSLNQLILFLTVVVEMSLLWRWDQYWY